MFWLCTVTPDPSCQVQHDQIQISWEHVQLKPGTEAALEYQKQQWPPPNCPTIHGPMDRFPSPGSSPHNAEPCEARCLTSAPAGMLIHSTPEPRSLHFFPNGSVIQGITAGICDRLCLTKSLEVQVLGRREKREKHGLHAVVEASVLAVFWSDLRLFRHLPPFL